MFLKAFRVKSQTAIKGSERKQLRSELERQYPQITSDQRKSVVPGSKVDMTVSKLCTHSGENVLVYSVLGNPVIFDVDGVLYPTVYLLWQHPTIALTTFTTWPPVLAKLQNGADLMLPGVVLPRASTTELEPINGTDSPVNGAADFPLGKFAKDQGCAVNLVRNRSCVAVGRTAMSSEEMRRSGMKGKGVIIYHTYGDQLWAMGDKSKPPTVNNASNDFQDTDGEEEEETDRREMHFRQAVETGTTVISGSAETNRPTDEDGAGLLTDLSLDPPSQRLAEEVNEDDAETDAPAVSSQESLDEILQTCFLQALRAYKKKAELPVLTSTFFRNHILPCCPKGVNLDLKKTSYKKLGKFLAEKKSEGIIDVKELTKGVESIVSINWDNDVLRSFKMPSAEPVSVEDDQGGSGGAQSGGGAPFTYTPPQIVDVYLVSQASLSIMSSVGKKRNDALTGPAVRQIVVDYVKENGLQDAVDKSVVRLDPSLCDAALDRGEYLETLKWEELQSRILTRMTRGYEITSTPGSRPEVRKGTPEEIKLDVVQRGSNKKVTVVHNLEVYGIDPAEFATLIQHGVACSASVSAEPGKNKGSLVSAQGNQIKYIASLLTDKYKLPVRYIAGLEKAPKNKKK